MRFFAPRPPPQATIQSPPICFSPSPTDCPNRRNILIVGDAGVGKSSLVNLIAGEDLAKTSGGAKSCTLQSQEHTASLGGVEFALHDTAGLNEAQGDMGTKEYLDAVYQAYALISKLEQSGGINLLLFCMKGGRITKPTQQTYRLFVEVFCGSQVPVVIAITHLETHNPMEGWWAENEEDIKEYGFISLAHACITATRGFEGAYSKLYEQSREVIQRLLLEHSDRTTWKEEKTGWFKRLAIHMSGWLSSSHAKRPRRSDLKKTLVQRCGFSSNDADLVAREMVQVQKAGDAPGRQIVTRREMTAAIESL